MDRIEHRRENARLRLGIEAEFISMDGRQAVLLQDLSATGAKVQFPSSHSFAQGILSWMRYEVFCDVMWIDGEWSGMQFEKPISRSCLLETRAAAPRLVQDAANASHRHAEDFVSGRTR